VTANATTRAARSDVAPRSVARPRPTAIDLEANHIVRELDRAGHRMTEPRRAVAGLIAARDGHFTAAELVADARRRRLELGRATVFRALDLFASLNLVERVDLPGGEHAYVACDPVHHHHAICTGCGRSLDVADHGLAAVLGEIGNRSGFRVTAHRLELFGLCAACQGVV
jgi:Fur family ferric uptake transcriptional regulator